MSFQLPTGEEKAGFVQTQFDRIAARYDLTNDVISLGMHRLWKERAVDQLCLRPDGTYLDVCCGTGDMVLRIARRLKSRGRVTGIDFSRNMLSIASARALSAGRHSIIDWVEGDAQSLPFPDGSFDGAVCSFGLRNLTDLQAGISEMARVVKPGGKVVNLDLGHPTMPLFAPVFLFYFRRIVPILGEVLQRDRSAYTYLPESLATYPEPAGISKIFRTAGLAEVRHISLAGGSVALHVGTV